MICTNIHYVCAIFVCIVDSFSKAFSFIYEVFRSFLRPLWSDSGYKKLGSRRVMPSFDFAIAIGLNGCPAAIDYELCACHKAGFV